KQQKLDQANNDYQDAITAPNPYDLAAALHDYAANQQSALETRNAALQAAWGTYQSAASDAYNTYLAAPKSTPPQWYSAMYAETVALADAATVEAKAAEAIQKQYGQTLRHLELEVADVQAAYSNWSDNNLNSANLHLAVARADAEEEYQSALAEAQD